MKDDELPILTSIVTLASIHELLIAKQVLRSGTGKIYLIVMLINVSFHPTEIA